MSYEPFFEILSTADLTDEKRNSVKRTLETIFEGHKEEEDEEDIMPPNRGSFRQMIAFLEKHPELPVPAINLNAEGLFTVSYRQDGKSRKDFHVTFNDDEVVDEVKIGKVRGRIDVKRREAIRPSQIRVPTWAQNSNQYPAQS